MDQAQLLFLANQRRFRGKRKKKPEVKTPVKSIVSKSVLREAAAHEAFMNRTLPPGDRE